jgi:hypothetical protein
LNRPLAPCSVSGFHSDPAGNLSEYYSDMDCIIDDQPSSMA